MEIKYFFDFVYIRRGDEKWKTLYFCREKWFFFCENTLSHLSSSRNSHPTKLRKIFDLKSPLEIDLCFYVDLHQCGFLSGFESQKNTKNQVMKLYFSLSSWSRFLSWDMRLNGFTISPPIPKIAQIFPHSAQLFFRWNFQGTLWLC